MFMFVITLSCFVLSVPPFPHSFYGAATKSSANIASGTTVTARINNVVRGSFTITEAGLYGNATAHQFLPVAGNSSIDLTGETITFYIGCRASTTTYAWSSAAFTSLPLSVTSGYCGDGSCSGGESAGSGDVCTASKNTCQTDCGRTTSTTTSGGSSGTSSGSGAPVTDTTTPTEITDTTLISDILQSIDPESLGLDSVSSEDVTITIVQDKIIKTPLSIVDTITTSLNLATSEPAQQALTEIQEAIDSGEVVSLDVKKSLIVYKVKSKTTFKSTTVSLITSEFTALKDGKNVRVIETIPKTMAESADDVKFVGLQPTLILQADPIFEFDFAEVKEGDKKEIKYTINKKISEITSNTVAVYEESDEKPAVCGNNICEDGETIESCPGDCKVEKEPTYGWLIVGIIIVLGLVLYFWWKKKQNQIIEDIDDNFS
tara:strand:- start:12143 stop:13438 length:1296 start_codon:yes stop_codon:yes gene_type:complete